MKRQEPKYFTGTLLGNEVKPGDRITIAGLPGVFIYGPPPAKKHDYGIRSTNFPKPKLSGLRK